MQSSRTGSRFYLQVSVMFVGFSTEFAFMTRTFDKYVHYACKPGDFSNLIVAMSEFCSIVNIISILFALCASLSPFEILSLCLCLLVCALLWQHYQEASDSRGAQVRRSTQASGLSLTFSLSLWLILCLRLRLSAFLFIPVPVSLDLDLFLHMYLSPQKRNTN